MKQEFDNPQNLTPMDGMAIGDLVNLTLGEHDSYEVLRVHGGWLYTRMTVEPPAIVGASPKMLVGTTAFVPEPKPVQTVGFKPQVNGVSQMPPGGIQIVPDPKKPH